METPQTENSIDISEDDDRKRLIADRIKRIEALEKEIGVVEQKIARFPESKSLSLARIAANKWLLNVFHRPLDNYQKYQTRKLRTNIGLSGEDLMKILFKLDQIESGGMGEVRQRRRSLVSKINNELLPSCDKLLVEAQAVVTLSNKLNRAAQLSAKTVKPQVQSADSESSLLAKERLNDTTELDQAKKTREADEYFKAQNSHHAQSPTQTQARNQSKAKNTNTDSNKTMTEPDYQIEQRDDGVVVHLKLPPDEHADKLRFELEGYNDALVVHGRNFELPFQVNSQNYMLDRAKVRIISEREVQILIPRRRYSAFSNFNNYPPLDTFSWY